MSNRTLHTLVGLSACYVAAQIFADITSLRIIRVFGLSMDAGTLIYPFTFTLRDMIHKVGGASITRTLIILAAVINLFMAGLFWLVSILPPDKYVGPQPEFAALLAPVGRLVIASIVAEVIAELIDTEVYSLWVRRLGRRYQWGRVLASNAVSVPIDSILFVSIAFIGQFNLPTLLSIFLANVLIKFSVTLFSIPGIYLIRDPHPNHV